MDFLAHIFLPLTAAYVLWSDRFESPLWFPVAVAGLVPDFDKFLGVPGLLHSLVTLVPLCLLLLGVERVWRGELSATPIVVFFIASHLLLDLIDGGPVPALFPFIETGIGLQYPVRTVFGAPPFGLQFDGALVALRVGSPRPGHNTYGFIQGAGVASTLLFITVFLGIRYGDREE